MMSRRLRYVCMYVCTCLFVFMRGVHMCVCVCNFICIDIFNDMWTCLRTLESEGAHLSLVYVIRGCNEVETCEVCMYACMYVCLCVCMSVYVCMCE